MVSGAERGLATAWLRHTGHSIHEVLHITVDQRLAITRRKGLDVVIGAAVPVFNRRNIAGADDVDL